MHMLEYEHIKEHITPLGKFQLWPFLSGPLFLKLNNGCPLMTGSRSLIFDTLISQLFSINVFICSALVLPLA